MPGLPARPSQEYLRKAAKRIARDRSLPLAKAQFALAADYGFRDWAALMAHVARIREADSDAAIPLLGAVRAGDIETVRRLLAAGANPRLGNGRETPLHVAARRGPLALVETLLAGGALEWQTDAAGRTALDAARRGRARDRTAIMTLLDRHAIGDDDFRAAVAAIHTGDTARLAALLDAQPRLLRDRITEPEVYRRAQRSNYFLDPKLFWFIANNPTRVAHLPANIADIARVMIERGVEAADLDYALALTMTSSAARDDGQQLPLMRVLLAAGAVPTRDTIVSAAAHGELAAIRALLDAGHPLDAPIAATLGADGALRALIDAADPADRQTAFGLAAINGNVEAVRITLAAGADVNAFLPVHSHSTALHQAALDDDAALIAILVAAGARTDLRDALWNGTALDWADHEGRSAARAALAGISERAP